MRVGLSLLFIFCVLLAHGQLLDNSQGNALEDSWEFNSKFIKTNGICEVRVEHSIKPDGFEIENTGDISVYLFNLNGEIFSHQKINSLFGRSDTTNISHLYRQGQLCSIRSQTSRSIVTDTLIYQDSTLTITRFKQDLKRKLRRTKVNTESRNITWPNDTTKIILSRNDLGLPYYRETWIWTSSGYLNQFYSEFLISGEKKSVAFYYDKFARISERVTRKDETTLSEEFQYDRWGNLESVVRKTNGELSETQELLLSANGLPEAILSRRERSEEIVISKLFYRYCE